MSLISGEGGGGTLTSKITFTPAQFRASRTAPIVLVPQVGAGNGLAAETIYFVLPSVFTAFGGGFSVELVVGSDLTLANSLLAISPAALAQALSSGVANDVAYVSYGGTEQSLWTGPRSLLDNAALSFSATAVDPTGGAGNVTVYTTYSVFAL